MRKALAQPHTKQFLKFAVVGLISFGIDWGMLIALVELFHLDLKDGDDRLAVSFAAAIMEGLSDMP